MVYTASMVKIIVVCMENNSLEILMKNDERKRVKEQYSILLILITIFHLIDKYIYIYLCLQRKKKKTIFNL